MMTSWLTRFWHRRYAAELAQDQARLADAQQRATDAETQIARLNTYITELAQLREKVAKP